MGVTFKMTGEQNAEVLRVARWPGPHHIRARPCTPKINGKPERFIPAMLREWADAAPFPSAAGATV